MRRRSSQHTEGSARPNLFDAGILKPRIDYSRPLERVSGDEYTRLTGKRAAIYARIGKFEAEREAQWQIQECQDCARRYAVVLDDTLVFVDRGLEPRDEPAEGFEALLRSARMTPPPFDLVLITGLDRLDRWFSENLARASALQACKIEIITAFAPHYLKMRGRH